MLFDGSPVAFVGDTFKGRDKGLAVVAELSGAGRGGERVDGVGSNTGTPHTVGGVVKGEEEAEVAVLLGSLSCEVDGGGGVAVARCDVQGEGVNADISGFSDVVEPVGFSTASSIPDLRRSAMGRALSFQGHAYHEVGKDGFGLYLGCTGHHCQSCRKSVSEQHVAFSEK